MKKQLEVTWKQGMAFESEIDGFKLTVDAAPETGGENLGPRPKPLMMLALGGCTGMDVVSILKKMRIEPEAFSMSIEGEISDEHPKRFTKMHLVYTFKGKDLPIDKLEKAIKLSQEQYCGVSASYKDAMELSYEIKLL